MHTSSLSVFQQGLTQSGFCLSWRTVNQYLSIVVTRGRWHTCQASVRVCVYWMHAFFFLLRLVPLMLCAGDERAVGVPAVPNSCRPVQSVVRSANSWELEMTLASQLLQGRRGRGGVWWLCMWAMWQTGHEAEPLFNPEDKWMHPSSLQAATLNLKLLSDLKLPG